MEFIHSLPLPVQLLFFALLGYWGVVLWRNHRRAGEQYPEIAYMAENKEGQNDWRWADSPQELGLPVKTTATESWVFLHPVRSTFEVICTGLGLLFLAILLWSIIDRMVQHTDSQPIPLGMLVFIIVCFAGISAMLFRVDAPVTAIARTKDKLIFQVRMAAVFHRRVVFRSTRAKHLVFSGKMQGALTMNIDQLERLPDYYLVAKRRYHPSRRFLLRCTPSQGSWLVGG